MKRQSSAQEHETIELQEHKVEESETDHDKPLNAQTRKVGMSLAHLIHPGGENTTQQEKRHLKEHLVGVI